MKEKKPVLSLKNLTKSYKMGSSTLTALDNVSLDIYEGELVCILGPSGSGKSTLLHIMGLLDSPTSGLRFISGIDTSSMSDNDQATVRGSKIGFVFQRFNLIPSLTALENVALPLVITASKSDRTARAQQMLSSLGMGERLSHYPNQLSGGQMQRVAIARALCNNPDIILADEPTGNLDSKTGYEVLEILKSLNASGKTIVVITHDEAITKIAQRVVRIKDGKMYESR
ncbi:ABC transporter ATP-binding protein [Candidatus Micrarchaeota archaeon]|nr:ABC transporter ATP-binding protein [Candidatus Micrarchaeota archaeon]